ncbi:MAG TPA: 3-deoxy-D-manno-octulosonic acid transferase [Bacteroidales bacterium]|nr:3-deoxy-D-manno-octulosonic acid transferase [Bacteroidales bacterium]
MRLFYTFSIYLYGWLIQLAAIFNTKAAQWVEGRKQLFDQLEEALKKNDKPLIWMHCASLGEFEQGRPVLEAIKEKHPHYGILLTFFSPSGYEVRKNYELADFVFYLPLDLPKNADRFLTITKVELAIFVKYEYWYNYIAALRKRKIPVVLISAIFRPNQLFFRFYGHWFLNHLKQINWFFVQNTESINLLEKAGIQQHSLSGDTRFDRVAAVSANSKPNALIEKFKGNSKLLLVGSSWPADESLIYPLIRKMPDLKVVFAPHQIDSKHIQEIQSNSGSKTIAYSQAKSENIEEKQILIIDNFGLLSSLYRYADFTFIGGGFGAGIHNTLEAATFGMPIFIGPNYQKFQEAKDLVSLGAIELVSDTHSLEKSILSLIDNPEIRLEKGQKARTYVQKNIGATHLILSVLEEKNFLKKEQI